MQRATWSWLQHMTNPLHLYCRLLDLGFDAALSRRIGRMYEKFVYAFLVRGFKS